jgi:phospholipid transport system substrate-binding protein
MIRRRSVVAAAAAAGLAAVALDARARADAAGPATPVLALNAGLDALRKAAPGTPFATLAATLTPVVQQAFNLEDVVKATVGLRYANLPDDQKTALLQVFTDYTVASYVANFAGDATDRFVVDPQTRAVGEEQVVTSRIVPASGAATRLDYVVRQGPAGWRIVDVLIDGSISQVAVQRSDFRSLLGANSAERLIASLRRKTASLAAGHKG